MYDKHKRTQDFFQGKGQLSPFKENYKENIKIFFFLFLISRGQWSSRGDSCPLLPLPADVYDDKVGYIEVISCLSLSIYLPIDTAT